MFYNTQYDSSGANYINTPKYNFGEFSNLGIHSHKHSIVENSPPLDISQSQRSSKINFNEI